MQPASGMWRRLATAGASVLLAVACTSPPEAQPAPAAPTPAVDLVRQAGGLPAHTSLDDLCRQRFADVPPATDRLVGLMTDSGSINDGTFNQSAYEGMQAAARCFGFETTYVASGGNGDYATHMDGLVDQGVDAVVSVGFPLTDVTADAAEAHPDTAFVGLDQPIEDPADNHAAITFRDDQAGFLAGAAAALVTDAGHVAVVAGPETVPPVVALAEGFAAGVAHVDPDVTVTTTHLPSFSDPEAGATTATAALEAGADVVYGAAGMTGSGAVLEAAARGAFVIGVDQDQYLTTFEGGAVRGADRVVTSSVKRIDLAVFLQLADLAQGTFAGGQVILGIAAGGVTYAPPRHVDDTHLTERLEAVRTGLADGTIRTGLEPDDGARDAT